MNKSINKLLISLAGVVFLAGCGAGGGSKPMPTPSGSAYSWNVVKSNLTPSGKTEGDCVDWGSNTCTCNLNVGDTCSIKLNISGLSDEAKIKLDPKTLPLPLGLTYKETNCPDTLSKTITDCEYTFTYQTKLLGEKSHDVDIHLEGVKGPQKLLTVKLNGKTE